MCRSTDYYGFRSNDRDKLKIRLFFIQFSGLKSSKPLPESITLVYRPRINENELEIDGSKIRPDSPAFVTLHRVVSSSKKTKDVIFGSRVRVRVSEAVGFDVYLGEEKVVKGIFRKNEDEMWNLEFKCALEREMVGVEVKEAEVYVDVEGHVAMSERVAMVVKRRKKNQRSFDELEEIPEERETETESDGCCCSCSCGESESGSNGGDFEEEEEEVEMEMEMEMERVRWAVDVGFWVMCLGVGFLVSKASAKRFRRRRIL